MVCVWCVCGVCDGCVCVVCGRAFSGYTRRRPERAHGGVLNLHTEGFSAFSSLLSSLLSCLLSCLLSQQR